MPKRIKALSPLEVKRLKKVGFYFLGGVPGFALKIQKNSSSYVLRYKDEMGKSHDCFIGTREVLTLAQAREQAIKLKAQIISGTDPLKERRLARDAANPKNDVKRFLSLQDVADQWIKDRYENGFFRNNLSGFTRTINRLKNHVYPAIGKKSINKITPEDVYAVIAPLWETKTNTAKKLLTILRQVFNWAIAMHIREDRENPADIRTALGVLLEPQKRKFKESENFAAISVKEMPAFFAELDKLKSVSARALQFAILTASRSQAVRFATWDEVDLEKGIWTIPIEHDKMKVAKRDRAIMLSPQAINLLKETPRFTGQTKIFLSSQMQTLSSMTLSMVIRRLHKKKKSVDGIGWIDQEKTKRTGKESIVTQHGCSRATFRTWAKDDTLKNNRNFDQEAVELCLLHSKNDGYSGAYDRARLLEERRKIMNAWADYCCSAIIDC